MQIGVRAARQRVKMVDYHTVTGHPLRNAEEKPLSTGDTFISRRQYWQDASFLVVIQVKEEMLQMLENALKHPKWCLYLGRKSCIPSRPVLQEHTPCYADVMDALLRYPAAERAQYPMLYECEREQQLTSLTRPDSRPGTSNRQFTLRRVWRGAIEEGKACI